MERNKQEWQNSAEGKQVVSLGGATLPVGSFPKGRGEYGCYDMVGNVKELCSDWYKSDYYASEEAKRNPEGPSEAEADVVHYVGVTAKGRVLRGGCWDNRGDMGSAICRGSIPPGIRNYDKGFRIAEVLRVSARAGAPAPASQTSAQPLTGTLVLFDGRDCSAWQSISGQPCPWKVLEDGSMEVVPKSGDIATRQEFRDFHLHVEFWLPMLPPDVKDQKRANSGIFLQGRYEIQVLDSYNNSTYPKGGCCAIYKVKDPDNLDKALKPPETWNTCDITFRAARFDAAGHKTENARVTMLWNGVKAHDNVEIPGPSVGIGGKESGAPGPIRLQERGDKVRYRNIWIIRLEEGAPVKEAAATPGGVDDAFIKEVAALPAEEQVKRVVAKLKELNPDFDTATVRHVIGSNNQVGKFHFCSTGVTNMAPVSALTHLYHLTCSGPQQEGKRSPLQDLSPLRGLKLKNLSCYHTEVADLSPLRGMPLEGLSCFYTRVNDLTPLQGMPLKVLNSFSTAISDLTPLSTTRSLENLNLYKSPAVRDLAPLRGLPLKSLTIRATTVSDLSPLAGMPLETFACDAAVASRPENMKVLKSISTLNTINDLPAAEFWKKLEAGQVPQAR
jgi:hypothetical protein